MRNIFDQYSQPENRVTHALASALAAEPSLVRPFLRRVVGVKPPVGAKLQVVEQRLPGDPETEEEDPGRRGLPDMVIHDNATWAVAIEAKVAAKLTHNQLVRHEKTLAARGFESITLVALDVREHTGKSWPAVRFIQWPDVYTWARNRDSLWARSLADYLEIAESKFIQAGYLKEGSLTRFSGIPFGPSTPYNYGEAKRLLRLAMQDLRAQKKLRDRLDADLTAQGRSAITGKATHRVWDYIPLLAAKSATQHTEFPHLSFDIGAEQTRAYISVPNGVRTSIRKRLLKGGETAFFELMEKVLVHLRAEFRGIEGAAPFCYIGQRRYPTQRAAALIDAELIFDPRTAFGDLDWQAKPKIRHQEQWLRAAFETLAAKRSNIHFSVGMAFSHARCPAVAKPNAIKLFAHSWLGCEPLVSRLMTS